RRQRGENRDRMDVALVQNTQHQVDGHQRGQDQDRLVGERGLERLRRTLKLSLYAGWEPDFRLGAVDGLNCVAQRSARGNVERERDDRELPLMIDGERGRAWFEFREGSERDLASSRGREVNVLKLGRLSLEV